MNNPICHISPVGGVDDKIATILNQGGTEQFTKEYIGALRGLYDEENAKHLVDWDREDNNEVTDVEIAEAANRLKKYKESQESRHLSELKVSSKHTAKAFNKLYNVTGWGAETRRNRINGVAMMFSSIVSNRINRARKQGIELSREDVVNGWYSEGQNHDGQFSIFEEAFNTLFSEYKEAVDNISPYLELSREELLEIEKDNKGFMQWLEDCTHEAEEKRKMLANWSSLCTFARMTLRNTESLKLGANTLEYALPTTEDNFSMDSPMEDTYDMEESVREAWQSHVDETSAFGSMGKETRRFLSTVQEVDDEGNPVFDDLGFPVYMDPLEMRNYLAEVLRGVTSESKMIKKLSNLSQSDVRIKQVFDELAKASKADLTREIDGTNYPKSPIITQLLLDLHTNLVPFSALRRSKKSKNIYARILNRQSNELESEFLLRLQAGEALTNAASIYNLKMPELEKDKNKAENTNVKKDKAVINWLNLASWFAESQYYLPQPKKEVKEGEKTNIFAGERKYENFYKSNNNKKKDFLIRASRALGIPMSQKAVSKIISNPQLLSRYVTALEEFTTYGFQAALQGVNAQYFGTLVRDIQDTAKGLELSAERRLNNAKAIEALKSSGISYNQFLRSTFGSNQEDSPGFGMEQISKMLDVLATVDSRLKMERRVPWYDRKGNTNSRYSDMTPSYMGDLVDKLHEFIADKDRAGLQAFIKDRWGNSTFFYKDGIWLNKWIEELYNSIDERGNVNTEALAKAFMYESFLGANIDGRVDLFENFTEKQHVKAMLKHFVVPRFGNRKSTLAKYPSFILGDSGKQMFFTSRRYSIKDIEKFFKDIALQERERIKYVDATNNILLKDFANKFGYRYTENNSKVTILDKDGTPITDEKTLRDLGFRPIENFSQTANEFTQLPFLNSDFEDGKYWKMLTGETQVPASKAEAMSKALESLNTDAFDRTVKQYMQDSYEKFRKKLVEVGILKEIKKDNQVVYIDAERYFTQDLKNNYSNEGGIEGLLKDFYWNTKYATIQQIQLFTVDPAFYDHRYPVKDLQKRYKEIYAPGKGVSTEARWMLDGKLFTEDPYETAAYFDDISVSSKDVNPAFLKVIAQEFGEGSAVYKLYTGNTLTDGQGYRTLDSYRKVMGMSSQWTIPMESAYNRIKQIRERVKQGGEPISEAEIEEIGRLAVIFQPIKPYLYTLEKLKINDTDYTLIPVQHKYAEIVIIPELMADGKLKDVARWMEDNNVDLVASTKCVKVGAFGSTVLKDANSTEKVYDAMNKAFIHKLAWADYRIQSGVPAHLDQAQLFGTQPRKLILDNINKGGDYQRYLHNIFKQSTNDPRGLTVALPGPNGLMDVHLTGRNLISFYNCLIMAQLFNSYDKLTSQISENKDLADKLIQSVISNANQAEDNAFAFSLIEDGSIDAGDFLVPLGEPGLEHDATALMMSLFKKMVNKQTIHGGSAVQASAMGLKGWEDSGDLFEVTSPDGKNVLYDEIEMPWNRSYTTSEGVKVPLKYTDWVNPDGTLKVADGKEGRPLQILHGEEALEFLSWPVGGRDKSGRPLVGVDENGYAKQGYYKPLIEIAYPGILDTILYRIPTEKEYSMINAKVFRFSNPTAGGTLKTPSSRTTTAGFDFDIDKLYFFMREYCQRRMSQEETDNIWKEIYSQNREYQEFAKALEAAKETNLRGAAYLNELSTLFGHSEFAQQLAFDSNKTISRKDVRNFHYWETVKNNDTEGRFSNIPATPEEAFTKYLEFHRDVYDIFETYNPAVSPLDPVREGKRVVKAGNTRAARNNMLIDLFRQRLMDPETLKSRYTPGGFNNNREAALRMRVLQYADRNEITDRFGRIDWDKVDDYVKRIKDNNDPLKDPEPTYDFSDPLAILAYNQQNQIAGKLIGIFANQNTNHVYASTLHTMRLANPIKFGNHTVDGLGDFLHAPEGIDVGVNMAEYLAASVDAVKDPVLNFLNLNLVTADAASMLARIGYTPQEIGLLFNQPIIKELCDYVANNGVSNDIAIAQMLNRYGGKDVSLFDIKTDDVSLETNTLANNILQDRIYNEREYDLSKRSNDFKQGQLQVLALFNEILADTKDLNSFVQATRFTAANSVGSSWGHLIAQEERVQEFVSRYMADAKSNEIAGNNIIFQLFDDAEQISLRTVGLKDAEEKTSQGLLNISEELLDLTPEQYMMQMSRNPLGFEQLMMDLYRKAARKLFSRHFPFMTKLYNAMRTKMGSFAKYGVLDEGTIDSLHRDFIVYLLSKQKGSLFDGDAINDSLGEKHQMSNRAYYLNALPEILLNMQKTQLSDIPFFQILKITGEHGTSYGESALRISIPGVGGLQSYASNLMTEMWAEAYRSNKVVHSTELGVDIPVSKLAEDLYFYNFYTLGYNFHPTTFMHLAPTLLKLGLRVGDDMGYIQFINSLINNDIEITDDEIASWIVGTKSERKHINLTPSEIEFFAKQYMLNHLDNYKFVFTPKGIAKDPVTKAGYDQTNKKWKDSFSINFDSLDNSLQGAYTLSIGEKAIVFRPIIAVELSEGSTIYYMAEGTNFNVVDRNNATMTYKRVKALGTKGDRIRYLSEQAYNNVMLGNKLIQDRPMFRTGTIISLDGVRYEVIGNTRDAFSDLPEIGYQLKNLETENVRTLSQSELKNAEVIDVEQQQDDTPPTATPATPESSPSAEDGAAVERISPIIDNLTDEDWRLMFDVWKRQTDRNFLNRTMPQPMREMYDSFDKWKQSYTPKSDMDVIISMIEHLYEKIDKGGQFETKDEEGDDIKTCPINV